MLKYILKRFAYIIPTLLGVSILVFCTIRLIPGDPTEVMLGRHSTPELKEIAMHQLGLDRPFYIQFILWLKNILTGNWGLSIFSRVPVFKLILKRFAFSAKVALLAIFEISIFGILFGVISAYKADTITDKILRIISILFWSFPYFILALILLYIFALRIPILPSIGGEGIEHIILPSFSLSLVGIAYISRMTRGSILEVAGQDFVRTAQAKGLSKRRILLVHILKNAFLPVITMLGMQFGWLLSGSYIVETIFSLPGLGELTIRSILNRDYPIVQGAILFTAIIFSSINLFVDIIYAYLDPRVRYEGV